MSHGHSDPLQPRGTDAAADGGRAAGDDNGGDASEPNLGVSKMRWYMLFACAFVSGLQGGYWNNFGPIAAAVKPLFGWSNTDIAQQGSWGPIGYIIAVAPTAWLLDKAGLRVSCICAALLVFVGSLLRVVHVTGDPASSMLMHAGQLLNGLAGPVAMSVGPVLSATWFPPQERTTATAIVSVLNYGGTAAMFALGPLAVPVGSMTTVAADLRMYMLCEAGVAALLLVVTVFIPSRPPYPPSRSALVARTTMVAGLKQLGRNRTFHVVALCYGLVTGFFAGWGSMLDPIMQDVLPGSQTESDAGWMGFWGAIASIVLGIVFSVYSDRGLALGRKRAIVMVCCTGGAVSCAVFAWLCNQRTHTWMLGALYAGAVTIAAFCNGGVPLFYELAVEAAYPTAEGVTTCVLTTLNNLAVWAFLLLQAVPNIGTAWMNYACCLAYALSLPLLLLVHEPRRRLAVDMGEVSGQEEGDGGQGSAAEVCVSLPPVPHLAS
eukprot:NODE_5410_length_1773_cov_21.648238.p1 GENE.NODE_5410_length_1773_cov_21.648238~~NODE_5410_length_1773_cov_21.648238.p1  ORF type:complete len:490 (+),score=72.85 NODE_5410_length_1773_cov_21.648238:116-1585(+)